MNYYLHIEAQDYETKDYDFDGDLFEYKISYWKGPFEFKSEALESAIASGYTKGSSKITVIEFGD